MTAIIVFEILIALALYSVAKELLGINEKRRLAGEAKVKEPSFIEKINASVAIEKEDEIMLDHNYDGIHELDNDLPPWWKYGFYLTIIFSVIYMFYYHFSSGKLQLAEYEDEMLAGQYDFNEYRKKASNLVDENNATLLTDAVSLESGKSVYMDNCAACHGRAGEGGVGPNLTDDYWLHEGDIKGVFKTIKFGWPEKGMKSWQQDLSAKQIHEISSYVKSLRGTNPPNAKEKQGEIYSESNAVDTTNVPKKDSVQIALKGK
jgi:cytochrome c oxidase cbb3-type subunit 3